MTRILPSLQSPTILSTLLLAALLQLYVPTWAWVTVAPHTTARVSARAATGLSLALPIYDAPCDNNNDDEEEECEINWDLPAVPILEEDEADVDLQPPPTASSTPKSADDARVHMEMNWQMEECSTERMIKKMEMQEFQYEDDDDDQEELSLSSCEDFCEECAGNGKMPCRFCRGTGVLTLQQGEFKACLICQSKGEEECSSCRGTGRIAPWASTMEDYMQDKAL